jgi:thiamine pyrophosphokinase
LRYGLIFANGDFAPGKAVQTALDQVSAVETLIIAADGGLRHSRQRGLVPHLLVGDMDSLTEAEVQAAERDGAEIRRYSPHKDETDLELALIAAAEQGCDAITVIGGIGDRFDHTISNVYLLALPQLKQRDSRLVSGDQTLRLLYPGEHHLEGNPHDLLSLIPLTEHATGIITSNLEYPLGGETLYFGPARGVSNVFMTSTVTVKFDSGILLAVHTHL